MKFNEFKVDFSNVFVGGMLLVYDIKDTYVHKWCKVSSISERRIGLEYDRIMIDRKTGACTKLSTTCLNTTNKLRYKALQSSPELIEYLKELTSRKILATRFRNITLSTTFSSTMLTAVYGMSEELKVSLQKLLEYLEESKNVDNK